MRLNERDQQILEHILRYCVETRSTLALFPHEEQDFFTNFVLRNACSMPIMQIGELAKKLSAEFLTWDAATPWQSIKGMRNLFAHDYHGMDCHVIWATATKRVPDLETHVRSLLESDAQHKGAEED